MLKAQSARALTGASAILTLLAMAVGAPAGAVFLLALAALCAALGLLFGTARVRVVSAVLLLVALGFGAAYSRAWRREMDLYRSRAKERAKTQAPAEPQAPPPGQPPPAPPSGGARP